MDFVVNGVMIGGFAVLAAPAEYGVTGLKSFIVSHDGVVYEKDLGSETLDEFQRMELFNPDKSWVPEQSKVPADDKNRSDWGGSSNSSARECFIHSYSADLW